MVWRSDQVALAASLGLLVLVLACGRDDASKSPEPTVAPPVATPQGPGLDQARAEAAARRALAAALSVPESALALVVRERRDWPDASLGCPKPGLLYAQVITPGYRFALEHGGKRYEYHTNLAGSSVVTC